MEVRSYQCFKLCKGLMNMIYYHPYQQTSHPALHMANILNSEAGWPLKKPYGVTTIMEQWRTASGFERLYQLFQAISSDFAFVP